MKILFSVLILLPSLTWAHPCHETETCLERVGACRPYRPHYSPGSGLLRQEAYAGATWVSKSTCFDRRGQPQPLNQRFNQTLTGYGEGRVGGLRFPTEIGGVDADLQARVRQQALADCQAKRDYIINTSLACQ